MSLTIGMLLFEDLEELDLVGPWEVFTMASMGMEDVKVLTIAEQAEPVRCAKGLRLLPDHTFETAPPLDVILVPGGQGTRAEVENPVLIDWLRKTGSSCRWITSVCTGALLLQECGFLDGKQATTHWGFIESLRKRAAGVEVLENVRYVDDGNVVTAAGVSAGIDMALWLVGQIWDIERARQTQRLMEYDPAGEHSGGFHQLSTPADMSFVEASRILLDSVGRPMSTPEMVEELRKLGLRSQSKNPTNSLYASLLKSKKHFYRAGKKWALIEWRPTAVSRLFDAMASEDVPS